MTYTMKKMPRHTRRQVWVIRNADGLTVAFVHLNRAMAEAEVYRDGKVVASAPGANPRGARKVFAEFVRLNP